MPGPGCSCAAARRCTCGSSTRSRCCGRGAATTPEAYRRPAGSGGSVKSIAGAAHVLARMPAAIGRSGRPGTSGRGDATMPAPSQCRRPVTRSMPVSSRSFRTAGPAGPCSCAALAGCASPESRAATVPTTSRPVIARSLQLPEGVTGSERLAGGTMTIPAGGAGRCRSSTRSPSASTSRRPYFGKQGSDEGLGRRGRECLGLRPGPISKPDQVAAFYSPRVRDRRQVVAPAAYIADLKQEVARRRRAGCAPRRDERRAMPAPTASGS